MYLVVLKKREPDPEPDKGVLTAVLFKSPEFLDITVRLWLVIFISSSMELIPFLPGELCQKKRYVYKVLSGIMN
jgi:hypothetical protein